MIRGGWGGWKAGISGVGLLLLFVALGHKLDGVVQDVLMALHFRYQLDYGEGIVWQQVLLLGGPRMYSPSPDLPFIVFHYPPLYHAVVAALLPLKLDPLLAGRLVSVASTVASAGLIAALSVTGIRRRGMLILGCAVAAAGLFLCFNAVRTWGVLMRVDMLGIALGLAGTLVVAQGRAGVGATVAGLLLCTAAVFTKQTLLPAGVSVFLVALACAPRAALIGAVVAGVVGGGAAAALQLATGGFFQNIVGYNINPLDIPGAGRIIWAERESAPLLAIMGVGSLYILAAYRRSGAWRTLRKREPHQIAAAAIVLHFLLAILSAAQIVKEGSAPNYLLDMQASGCVVLGLTLGALLTQPALMLAVCALFAAATANLRQHMYSAAGMAKTTLEGDEIVQRIREADRPVASDDMTLVMRAGRSLVFEPAIVRVLVAGGRWDPAPLLAMIEQHGFAFMVTFTDGSQSGPLVTKAIEAAYPREEQFIRNLTLHYPP